MTKKSSFKEIFPQSKMDTEKAEAIVALGYPTVEPILPELIEWLQDYNWPVAQILAPFLGSIGLPLLPHVRFVLATDDEVWKYWVLACVIAPSPSLVAALGEELSRLANAPTANEVADELDIKAREILSSVEGRTVAT